MKIFDLINNQVEISEEAYILKPFKKLWDRDKSKDKAKAIAELGYIYFMEDFKSDFSDIIDAEERSEAIITSLTFPKNWKPDVHVDAGLVFYKKWTETYSLKFVRDAKLALEQIRLYFRTVNIEEVDSQGRLKFDIIKLARIIENSDALLNNLSKLENRVKKDMQQKSSARGGKSKNIFEDGI